MRVPGGSSGEGQGRATSNERAAVWGQRYSTWGAEAVGNTTEKIVCQKHAEATF